MNDVAGPDWPARHFDGLTPEPHDARVRLEPGGLIVSAGDAPPRHWPIDGVTIVNAGTARDAVQLELRGEPTEALVVTGPDFLQALEAAGGGTKLRRLSGSPIALRVLAVLTLVVGVLLFAAWRWGMPALAAVVTESIPPAWEQDLGEAVLHDLAPESHRVRDSRITRPVDDAFARLLTAVPVAPDSFHVVVIRSAVVNAFAAPGGFVVVTTGLLRVLDDSEELAAVLAHEIVHLTERHALRGMLERLGLRAMLGLLSGDDSAAGALLGAAGTMGEMSYSRSDETEADEGAAALLARAGIPPDAIVRALDRVSGAERDAGTSALDFLSTHPATAGRRARARELAAQLTVEMPTTAPDSVAWATMDGALVGVDERL